MLPILLVSNDKKITSKYVRSNLREDDVLFFEMAPEGTKYLISQIREVIRQTFIFNPKKRVYFFPDFHVSSIEAQNAFLKGLEESPENVQFVLGTDSLTKLLPTVVSRTKIINLEKTAGLKPNPAIQKQLDLMLAKKSLGAFDITTVEVKGKEEAILATDQFVFFFRGRLAKDAKAAAVLKEILRERSLIENNNLTPQLALDHILIFIAKAYNMKI